MSDSKAIQAEIGAFNKVSKKLGTPEAFAKPAGFETSFPDFGFRLNIAGKKVDLHIEYKADAKAQMGSMRDWIFDGYKFITPSTSEDKKDLIAFINDSSTAISNGKRLLKDLQEYADPKISKIYSGTMTIESNKDLRRAKLMSFAAATKNYQIANIDNEDMGQKIIDHYKKKFKISQKHDAQASALLMMIKDRMWIVDSTIGYTKEIDSIVATMLGVKSIDVMRSLKAKLEVRIQPRGLNSPGKPVSIDVMASFRLSGSLHGGILI